MSPKITPGYWQCPRCDSKDVYFAPRVVGQVGIGRGFEFGDVEIGGGGLARGVEKDVALCKACSERMKWIPEIRVYSKEEEKNRAYKVNLFYLFFGLPCVILPFWFSTYGWSWESTMLLLIGSAFTISGLVGLSKGKK